MTTKEFLEKYNGAPCDLEELADLVFEITDNTDLVDAAMAFLEAEDGFETELDDIGFEFG